MKSQFIKHRNQWSAFMTICGIDIQEYGYTEIEARQKLAKRIAESSFLLNGIKLWI